jgi:exodeoxyribonuclease VIII
MASIPAVNPNIKPGIYTGIPNEAYHDGPGISKSGLWTIHTKSPAHFWRGERKETKAFDFGEACHLAILEPNLFEKKVVRGPDDRRGNKWKDLAEVCRIDGKLLLTSGDFDNALAVRDAVHADPFVSNIVNSEHSRIEVSGYWIDPETNVLCRCRPDNYREDLGVIVDVKSTASAHPDDFARSVVNYGYHAQEAWYSDGLRALGKNVEGFVFLAWEKTSPYAFGIYELPPAIVEEGRAIMRRALETYAECMKSNIWPAYGNGVQELAFSSWAYRLTEAPSALDTEIA